MLSVWDYHDSVDGRLLGYVLLSGNPEKLKVLEVEGVTAVFETWREAEVVCNLINAAIKKGTPKGPQMVEVDLTSET